MRPGPTNGASTGRVRSSTSKLMAHWRAKYSDGRSDRSGQKPPKDSACSSRRSSQNGAQPPPDSRKMQRRPGWRSSTPKAISWAQASISSKGWDTACRTSGLNGRSDPSVGTMTELPSWIADGHVELLGGVPHRVVGAVATASGRGRGWGGRTPPRSPSSVTARRSSRAAASGSCRGSMAAPKSRRRVGGAVAGQPVVVRHGQPRPRRPGRRRRRSRARSSGTGPPGRCPRCPCRPDARTGSAPPGWASASGRNREGSSKVEPGRARLPSGTARISVAPTTTCS